MTDRATLRPLAIGEIIDRAASFWHANWRSLFVLLLGFQLMQYAMVKAIDLLLQRTLRDMLHGAAFDPIAWFKNPPLVDTSQLGTALPLGALFIFATVLLSQITGVAASAYVYPRLTGGSALTVARAVRVAFTRLGATTGAVLLSFGLAVLMGVLFFAPAMATVAAAVVTGLDWLLLLATVLWLGGVVVLVLWFVLRFILTAQVTAAEPLSAWGIFRRTGALCSGRIGPGFTGWVKGRLTILVTIVFGILFLVSTLTGLPAVALQLFYGSALDPTRDVTPLWLLVPAELLQVVASAVIDPLSIVFQVIFYLDMRVRREGLDLELALKPAGEPQRF